MTTRATLADLISRLRTVDVSAWTPAERDILDAMIERMTDDWVRMYENDLTH